MGSLFFFQLFKKGPHELYKGLQGLKPQRSDFPGGAVVKNLPANAGDTGLSPSPGRSHMLWGN